jgi:hypothetical protein
LLKLPFLFRNLATSIKGLFRRFEKREAGAEAPAKRRKEV